MAAQQERLSKRALEILHLVADGLSDREIAERLVMTVNTIKWYNHQTYSILGVNSRTQAIVRASELNLLDGAASEQGASEVSTRLPRHNLGAETTNFIGRRRELADVRRLLESSRLVTLLGSPGTGKTRLAQQAGRRMLDMFSDGVWFVSLAPVSDAALVPNAIAATLGIAETQDEPLIETLTRALREAHMLLILDNFEHVLPAAKQISALLSASSQLKVLATSREPLHLYGEQEYPVAPLALPDFDDSDVAALESCESVALFVQHARAVRPDFALNAENAVDIAKICVRLEGLPLAIELAAARIKLLSPRALLERLTSRLDTLTGGAQDLPPRQQTLRRTIDWSYNLLSDDDKAIFAQLSVFAGGWMLDAAENICIELAPGTLLDSLTSLLDKSLIQQTDVVAGEPRFSMLETIREYAAQHLKESGQEDTLRTRHAAYYTTFAERTGRAMLRRYKSIGLTELEIEQNNFRAVLAWAAAGHAEQGLRLIAALGTCWRVRSYIVEGMGWVRRLLALNDAVDPLVRASALSSSSRLLACFLGNHAEAVAMSAEALALARTDENKWVRAGALFSHGAALMVADVEKSHRLLEEALVLYRELDDPWNTAQTINVIGEVLRLKDEPLAAERCYRESLALFRDYGNPWGANIVLQNLAHLAHDRQEYDQAEALFVESLHTSQELGDRLAIVTSLNGLGGVRSAQRQPETAARLLGAAEALRMSIGAQIQAADRPHYEQIVAETRAQLDAAAFEAAWAEGRRMTLDEAMAYALR